MNTRSTSVQFNSWHQNAHEALKSLPVFFGVDIDQVSGLCKPHSSHLSCIHHVDFDPSNSLRRFVLRMRVLLLCRIPGRDLFSGRQW